MIVSLMICANNTNDRASSHRNIIQHTALSERCQDLAALKTAANQRRFGAAVRRVAIDMVAQIVPRRVRTP